MKRKKCYLGILAAAALLTAACGRVSKEAFPEERFETPPLQEVQEAYASLTETERPDAERVGPESRPQVQEAGDTAGNGAETEEEKEGIGPVEKRSNLPEDYAGVTEVALEKVQLGEEELYRMGNTDYLMMEPLAEDAGIKKMVAGTAAKWNSIQERHPDVKLYAYFVNRARDMDWYEDSGFSSYSYADYFENELGMNSGIRFGQYRISDMQAYMETGYKTDFHVNHRGSYEVYEDVYQLMAGDMELTPLLEPLRENDYDSLYFVGQLFLEEEIPEIGFEEEQMDLFRTYSYSLGNYDSYVGDRKMTVGLEEEYEEGAIVRDITFDHQFSYYGGRADVIRFDFHNPRQPNLLIISDSQGRPSRKLIASHFNQTWFIDDTQYRSMDIDQLIEENQIGAVLLIGQYGIFEWYEK